MAETFGLFAFELPPLIECKDVADAEYESSVGFFELGARLRDTVDLGEDSGFVRMVRIKQRSEDRFLPAELVTQFHQMPPVLVKQRLHSRLLMRRDAEALDDHRIVPPHSGRPDNERRRGRWWRHGWRMRGWLLRTKRSSQQHAGQPEASAERFGYFQS